jgi:hypothetical protein
MDNTLTFAHGADHIHHNRVEFDVDTPHYADEFPRFREHRAVFRDIIARGEQGLNLPLHAPPVVDTERKIDEDDGIRQPETFLNRVKGAKAVDNPLCRDERW